MSLASRTAVVASAAALVVAGGVLVAPAAMAYPPGTALSGSAEYLTVAKDKYDRIRATNAQPGCYVTFSARGAESKRDKADSGGRADVKMKFRYTGSITVTISTSGRNCTPESTTVIITVTGKSSPTRAPAPAPRVSAPKSGPARHMTPAGKTRHLI